MSKARTLANLMSDNAELADGQIGVAEVVGAAPLASPSFTGNLAVTGTVDGVDIAARDAVLTTTTNTSNAALPKVGGTLTGPLNITQSSTADTIRLTRGATSNNSIIKFKTGSADKWIVGQRNDSTDHLRFYSYGTSSDVLSIKTDGKVGIGTTSPTGAGTILHLNGSGTVADFHMTNTTSGVAGTDGFIMRYSGLNTEFLNREAGASIFYTSATERMRINPNGRITTFGTGNANAALNLLGEGGAGYRAVSFEHTNGGGEKGSITTSASSTSYNTSSDYRLKENVVDLTGASARVNQLDVKRFNFIADDTNTLVDGFLAHEVATVVPEAIHGTKDAMMDEEYEVTAAVEEVTDDDGNVTTEAADAVMGTRNVPNYQGIDQSKLVPLLTAALQEALAKIDAMETRLTALEG